MKDKEIADLFADGKMKVKHTWIRAYDSESGKEGWISLDQFLHNIFAGVISDLHKLSVDKDKEAGK